MFLSASQMKSLVSWRHSFYSSKLTTTTTTLTTTKANVFICFNSCFLETFILQQQLNKNNNHNTTYNNINHNKSQCFYLLQFLFPGDLHFTADCMLPVHLNLSLFTFFSQIQFINFIVRNEFFTWIICDEEKLSVVLSR